MTDAPFLTLTKGRTTLDLWPLGARINRITFAGSDSLVDGAASEAEALGAKLNHGSLCGPVANRIAGGTAAIAGRDFAFERNENGRTTLHSGAKSTRSARFEVVEAGDDHARLALDIAHMADDFPGNRRIELTCQLHDTGFDLSYRATSDAPSLMNLAWHPYWTLGRDRAALALQIFSDRYLPVDDDKTPTGEIADVTGTAFDLRTLTRPGAGIDHNYCLDPGSEMRPAARLASDTLMLDIDTTAPGVQIFTGKPLGIAIEPQHWPDAPHHAHFPSILLTPDAPYTQQSRYRFTAR
ncbi:MAG: galactose mutarotase [Silicimonas sp.]|nr:galactose mutarotase [Silicimonas sp.]